MRRSLSSVRSAAITTLVVLLAPVATAAQAERGGVRLGLGLVRHGQTDLMASPLRYRGTAPHGTLGYRRVRAGTRLEVAASFSRVDLESRITDEVSREALYLTSIRSRWVRRVADRGAWEAFLGGRVDVFFPLRRHEYYEPGSELFGDVFAPLKLAGVQELRLTADAVAWQTLAVPLAAVVLRTPYAGLKYFPDVEFAPPGRLLGLDHAVGVDLALGGRWSVRGEWRTSLLRYPDPRELSMVTHRVELGLEARL